jgi:two-component system sensor histidine kinase CiaH
MTKHSVINFLRSTTARLAVSYLTIIMVLSVGFSFVLYRTSALELGRQIPPASLFNPVAPDPIEGLEYHHFFERRIEEGRGHLLVRLILLNLFVLLTGAALSYYLARRTLQPIENAMEAQSRFVTDASHELRTPLTSILASNEVAQRKPNLTVKQARDTIKSNTEEMIKLQALTDGLLSLAAQDINSPLSKLPVSLQSVAGEAMNRVLTAAQAKQIAIQDNAPDIKVAGDQTKLVQVATILLDNAIKYSPEKSTIHIEGHDKDGHGYLSIKDKGVGMAAEDLPRIFDRFYRADPARAKSDADGYGIGLSIARKIIEQHHGRITVNSAPGKGTTFVIELPLASAEKPA